MSSSQWETHGGVRYKVDNGAGSVDRDGWTRFPTNPRVIVVGHQEYTAVKKVTKEEAVALSFDKWSERTKENRENPKITPNPVEAVKPSSFDEWVCLGGEYRDMVEVDEWAPKDVRKKLLVDYNEFVKANQRS